MPASTAWLGDVTFRILLLDDRVTVHMYYGWFELLVNYLSQDDDTTLVKLLEAVFATLTEIDTDAYLGQAQVTLNTHLSLSTLDAESFLRKHLLGGNDMPDLIPDAFVYSIKLNDSMAIQEPRVTVMKSIQFDNALFVNFSVVYSAPSEPAQTSERFGKDYEQAFELIGLKFNNTPKDGDAI